MFASKSLRIEARFRRANHNDRIVVRCGDHSAVEVGEVRWTDKTPKPSHPDDDTRLFLLPQDTPYHIQDDALLIDGAAPRS